MKSSMKKYESVERNRKTSIDDEFAQAIVALNAACQHLGRAGVAFNRDLASLVDVFGWPEDHAAYRVSEAIGSAARVIADMTADTSILRRAAEQSRLAHLERPRYRFSAEARAHMRSAQHRRFANPVAKARQSEQLAHARSQRRQERARKTTSQKGGAA